MFTPLGIAVGCMFGYAIGAASGWEMIVLNSLIWSMAFSMVLK